MRRVARGALTVGVVVALAATGAAPAFASDTPTVQPAADKPIAEADEKFGTADATRLEEAKESGAEHVTMLIAAEPGETAEVAEALESVAGTSVGFVEDSVGYVRATVTTDRADAAIDKAVGHDSVFAIDLNEEIQLPDPTPDGKGSQGKGKGKGGKYTGPDAKTPVENPYMPSHETGAVDWVKHNPRSDGRGVTIGVLDSGVDPVHPALQETTTGERKLIDSVTATDPIIDNDRTWLAMQTAVSGPSFDFNGRNYQAPDGDYLVALFRENATVGGDMNGDLNRDGDTTDSWAVLYDPAAGTVTVDLDDDGDFTNDTAMQPYKENHEYGLFGTDNPETDIAEAIPFVVEIREDVPLDPLGQVGQTADFVNIGVVSSSHGTHVAGIAAANGLFGGKMNGAAPGAKVVSSRACNWSGGCTATALTEGMIDIVVNRGVDIVNMSIGGLPALNDGNNARARLYTELIDTYGVQLVISAGNSGPGANTVGDPSVASKVLSVGAAVSKETWEANYGSVVKTKYDLFPFSSRGPRADGGFKPDIVGPGAAISTIPTWQAGSPVPEAGYDLPAGYGMANGTSMSAPAVAGSTALLISAAKQRGFDFSPAQLRSAMLGSAKPIKDVQAYEQGSGRMDTVGAWRQLVWNTKSYDYEVQAPVSHDLSEFLATPHVGTGVYDRETGPAVGKTKTYDITFTRTSGPSHAVYHQVKLEQNHGNTFKLKNNGFISMPLNKPVTVQLEAKPKATGIHSAIVTIHDFRTAGVSHRALATVIVPEELGSPGYSFQTSGSVQRNETQPFFVRVPEGTQSFEIAIDGLAEGSQTRWLTVSPWGVPLDNQQVFSCYNNFDDPRNTCRPDLRSYDNPSPGVYELIVDSRRTSPHLDNSYTLTASALGTVFDPAVQTVDEVERDVPASVEWDVTNEFAAIDGALEGGQLGSGVTDRPSIGNNERIIVDTVELGSGISSFEAVIGNPSDAAADLDLYVYRNGVLVGQGTTGSSEERVVLNAPVPGTYSVEVHAWSAPSGSTEYDFRDVYYSAGLGEVTVGDDPVQLGNGESLSVSAEVIATSDVPAGRELFGEVKLLNDRGTSTGSGSVRILSVTG